jgi:hypothetical protein
LHSGQEQGDENADNGDNYEEFNEGEGTIFAFNV